MAARVVRLEELADMVGESIGPSDWEVVDQTRIDTFADAVSDHNWIHVDAERAGAAFGGTIAHGLLTLSMAPPMAQTLIDIVDIDADLNYGFDKVRFLSVIHAGDRVRLWLTVLGAEPRGTGQMLRMEYRIEVEGREKPAIVADWLFILFPQAEGLARQAGLATA